MLATKEGLQVVREYIEAQTAKEPGRPATGAYTYASLAKTVTGWGFLGVRNKPMAAAATAATFCDGESQDWRPSTGAPMARGFDAKRNPLQWSGRWSRRGPILSSWWSKPSTAYPRSGGIRAQSPTLAGLPWAFGGAGRVAVDRVRRGRTVGRHYGEAENDFFIIKDGSGGDSFSVWRWW